MSISPETHNEVEAMRTLPPQEKRVETGPLQFGEDWPGVFIRGDNAMYFAMCLENVLNREDDKLAELAVRGLIDTLRACDARSIAHWTNR